MAAASAAMQLVPNIKILVVDDEPDFLRSVEALYGNDEYVTVETCISPEEAIKILKKDFYHIVIADVNFKKTSKVSGITFVLENKNGVLAKSRVIMITGLTISKLENRNDLNDLEVPIQDKDSEWQEIVSDYIDEAVNKRLNEVKDFLKKAQPDLILSQFEPKLSSGVKNIFLEWLASFSNKEEKIFLMGGEALSASDLYEHVEDGTALGDRLFKMFVREIRYSFKLENGNGNRRKNA